jgi:hypothetical protein
MSGRGILDERTRGLIPVGQFLVMDDKAQFAMHIRNALNHTSARGAGGDPAGGGLSGLSENHAAGASVYPGAKNTGCMKELSSTQLPVTGRSQQRSLEAGRKTWCVTLADGPRQDQCWQ